MGSMITLGIGRFELDWGKNHVFIDHSSLFLPDDVKEIPYYYADDVVEYKKGFSRELAATKRRLELLGYPLHRLKSLYESTLASMPEYYPKVPLTFEEFQKVLITLDIGRISFDEVYADGDYDPGEFVSKYLFKQSEFNKQLNLADLIDDKDIGTIFEGMDPYVVLRILMENPNNAGLELGWRYADVVDGGWVEEKELYNPLEDGQKILLVTEGSSDSFVIARALELLYPDIKDFFCFVDMEKHYPFTGTGNLYRFCQGLSSIKIQNKVLVIYDNDVEGANKYNLSTQLALPENMRIVKLPIHEEFKAFATVGPNGQANEDINGAAVSIECFLDLSYNMDAPPCIRWTSYDRNTEKYQGELINKDLYVRQFGQQRTINSDYDFGKLKYLIDYLYNEWISAS